MKLLPLKFCTASSASRELSNSTKPNPVRSPQQAKGPEWGSPPTCHDAAVDDSAVAFKKLGDVLRARIWRETYAPTSRLGKKEKKTMRTTEVKTFGHGGWKTSCKIERTAEFQMGSADVVRAPASFLPRGRSAHVMLTSASGGLRPHAYAIPPIRRLTPVSGVTDYLISHASGDFHASHSCSLSHTSTMLSRVASAAVRRTALRASASRTAVAASRRGYVQPSGADRASVVDVPSTYQEDAFFSPRAGVLLNHGLLMLSNALQICSGSSWRHPGGRAVRLTKFALCTSTCRYVHPYSRSHQCSSSVQATTPVDPRVLDAMLPFLTDQYGNPHSRTHAYGWEAEKAIEDARKVCSPVFRH